MYVDLFQWQWDGLTTFWVMFFAVCTYGNAGWLREKMCIYMCPYSRFQSAMFDKNTLLVAYDKLRGENRGRRKRKDDPKALVLTVIFVLKFVRLASIFVMACSMNALTVVLVLMPVIKP